jgi:hypothetical protein
MQWSCSGPPPAGHPQLVDDSQAAPSPSSSPMWAEQLVLLACMIVCNQSFSKSREESQSRERMVLAEAMQITGINRAGSAVGGDRSMEVALVVGRPFIVSAPRLA